MEGATPGTVFQFFRAGNLPFALLILLGTAFLSRVVTRVANDLSIRFTDRRLLIQQFGAITRFVIYLAGISACVLSLFQMSEQLLLALGGTAAVAVGFATKDLAASILAGLVILADRPFQVGDRVTFEGNYGEIRAIGLRSVQLVTLDDTQVTIPNNRFLTESVASGNAGAVNMMIEIDFWVGIDQDLETARRIVSEALTTSVYVLLEKTWSVAANVMPLGPTVGVRLRAKGYVIDVRFEKAFETDVTIRGLEALRAAGIRPPSTAPRTASLAP